MRLAGKSKNWKCARQQKAKIHPDETQKSKSWKPNNERSKTNRNTEIKQKSTSVGKNQV